MDGEPDENGARWFPAECVKCGSETGPLLTLDTDCLGWLCRSCYDALQLEDRKAEIDALCNDGECPFCNWELQGRPIMVNCDEEEIYCPNCGYVAGIE